MTEPESRVPDLLEALEGSVRKAREARRNRTNPPHLSLVETELAKLANHDDDDTPGAA